MCIACLTLAPGWQIQTAVGILKGDFKVRMEQSRITHLVGRIPAR